MNNPGVLDYTGTTALHALLAVENLTTAGITRIETKAKE